MKKPSMPLEDELGDVLEKAMRHSRLDEETLAARTGIPSGKILDAIDYRPDLSCDEIRRLAEALATRGLVTPAEFDQMDVELRDEVAAAWTAALAAPFPATAELLNRVWAQ